MSTFFSKWVALVFVIGMGSLLLFSERAVATGATSGDISNLQSALQGTIQNMNTAVTNAINNMTTSLNTTINNLADKMKNIPSAMINYEAAVLVKKYYYDLELLYMVAPGTQWALDAGYIVGATDPAAYALFFSTKCLLDGLASLSAATEFNLMGTMIPKSPPVNPVQVYQSMQDFFTSGDTAGIKQINPGTILLQDNVKGIVTPAQIGNLINMLTNPFPQVDPAVVSKLKAGTELSGADMEQLGVVLSSYALIGIGTSAWGDIVSRRIPANGQNYSVMEVMDVYSSQRFTNSNWYSYLGAASETAILREIAHMMAFNQFVSYQHFRVSEQQLAALASVNSVLSNLNTTLNKLIAQLQAAEAQAKSAQSELKLRQLDNE